jgi:hypothetical protein
VTELERVPWATGPERHRLAASLRALLDTVVRTGADETELAAAADRIDELTAALGGREFTRLIDMTPDSYRAEMSLVGGTSHPFAPQLRMTQTGDGAYGSVTLGAACEGGPGLVHGGVLALLLDYALAWAAAVVARPTMTGTMTLDFLRPTPLGVPLEVDARVVGSEGRKISVTGTISVAGETTVRSTGLFIALTQYHIDTLYRPGAATSSPVPVAD